MFGNFFMSSRESWIKGIKWNVSWKKKLRIEKNFTEGIIDGILSGIDEEKIWWNGLQCSQVNLMWLLGGSC